MKRQRRAAIAPNSVEAIELRAIANAVISTVSVDSIEPIFRSVEEEAATERTSHSNGSNRGTSGRSSSTSPVVPSTTPSSRCNKNALKDGMKTRSARSNITNIACPTSDPAVPVGIPASALSDAIIDTKLDQNSESVDAPVIEPHPEPAPKRKRRNAIIPNSIESIIIREVAAEYCLEEEVIPVLNNVGLNMPSTDKTNRQ